MRRVTIDNITLICSPKEVDILQRLLGHTRTLDEETNEPQDNNIEILFEALNKPLTTYEGDSIICYIPEMRPLTPKQADRYIFDNYGCYFPVAAWLFRNEELYKEYGECKNATFVGGGVWIENGLTQEENCHRRALIEEFQSCDYNGVWRDSDSIQETGAVLSLVEALNICEEWAVKYNIFEENETIKEIYGNYREYVGNPQDND